MIFWCYPPSGKCEWAHLRDFVAHFNSLCGKSYRLSKCLDVEIRDEKQPEVLIEAAGEIPLVIERKSVVWPPEYFSNHSNEHDLFQRILELIGSSFQDTVYQLTIGAASLKDKKKREVIKLAEQIARSILANQATAKTYVGLYSRKPVPWSFRPLSSQERDESIPEKGVGFIVISEPDPGEPAEIIQRCETAKLGFAREFKNAAEAAVKKFQKYKECLKVLLVQFHGNGSFILDEDLIEIIKTAELPALIDQVWVAQPEWVSQDDYNVIWERIR